MKSSKNIVEAKIKVQHHFDMKTTLACDIVVVIQMSIKFYLPKEPHTQHDLFKCQHLQGAIAT